jgi:membrane protein required for colicin V production
MGTVDIVILVIVLAGALIGAFKGFISQFVSIASLVIGIWGASCFTPAAAGYLKGILKIGETSLHILCFAILLLAIIAICGLIGRGIEKIIHLSLLGWLNRVLGLVFATIKVVLVMSLITVLIGYMQKTWGVLPENIFSDSQLYPHLTDIADKLCPVLKSLVK